MVLHLFEAKKLFTFMSLYIHRNNFLEVQYLNLDHLLEQTLIIFDSEFLISCYLFIIFDHN